MSKSVKVKREEFSDYSCPPSRKAIVKGAIVRRQARKIKRISSWESE